MDTIPAPPTDDPIFMPLCAVFRRFLKKQNLKFTSERASILDIVVSKQGVFEAEDLSNEIRKAGHKVSKATIYRTLKHLLDAQIISEVLIDPKLSHYRMSYGKSPKGHLVCIETAQIIEFDIPQLDQMAKEICQEKDFDYLSKRLIIYGVSPQAKNNESNQT